MGMVIVESGWGSLVPTVVIANMSPFGAAARSGKLNIGDQIMSINGTSLVGLPLAQCQQIIKVRKYIFMYVNHCKTVTDIPEYIITKVEKKIVHAIYRFIL